MSLIFVPCYSGGILLYESTTNCLSILLLIDCGFQFVAVLSTAAMNKSFWGHVVSFLLAKYLGDWWVLG